MPVGLRRTLLVLLAVLAAAYAHRPLLGVGFLGDDARTLVELDTALREEGGAALWRVDSLHGRPLAAWSLSLSKAMHAREGRYTPGDAGRLRLEGLALLALAAFGMWVAVRRGLAPWTGAEHGRAAGFTAAVLLLVHPLATPAAAHLGDRGDMLGLALGLWAVAAYLTFRQARSRGGLAWSWLLTLAAAASSPLAYGLPIVLAVLELASADRHRSLRRRTRTATTTVVVYAAAVLAERVVRAFADGEASHVPEVDRSPLALLGVAAEKLGVMVLPVNTVGVGVYGYLLAVLAALAALHPGFVAARAAPRLWGRILGAWAACIAALLALTWSVRSAPAELGDARSLLAAAAVMAAGLGVASTALSGARRTLLPGLAVAVYAPLAAGNAATIEDAASRVGEAHAALLAAGERTAFERAVWLLDPPRKVAGVTALRPEDEAALVAAPFRPATARRFDVYGLPSGALRFHTARPEFVAERATGVTLVSVVPEPDRRPSSRPAPEVAVLEVPGELRGLSSGVFAAGSLGAGQLVVDPLRARALVAVPATEPTRAAGPPVLRFRGTALGAEDASTFGAWVLGEQGWLAVFDLERRPEWVRAGTVEALWLPGPLADAVEVRLLDDLPPLVAAAAGGAAEVRPRVVGEDWVFDVAARVGGPSEASEWVLATFDAESRRYVERPAFEDGGRLRVLDVAPSRPTPGAVHWSLERRVEGVTVAQARGVN